jgi:hypothetical protein
VTFDVSPPPEPRFCHQCAAPVRLQFVAPEGRERLVSHQVAADAIPWGDLAFEATAKALWD